jgi:hypothetical protein
MNLKLSLSVAGVLTGALLIATGSTDARSERPPARQEAPQARAAQGPAGAVAMYRWIDGAGRVHYTQGLDSIPEQFRDKAVPLGQAGPAAREPGRSR